MKRLLSLMLAMVLLLTSVAFTAAATNEEQTDTETTTVTEPEVTEPEDSGVMTVSDDLVELLKYEEGFCKYPVWDYSQYTVGYGTRCPSDKVTYYKNNGITHAEAEQLLRNHLVNTETLINTKLIQKYNLNMTQGQFDALVMFSYNMGGSWITSASANIHQVVAAGTTDNQIVDALSRWCKAGGAVQTFLVRRRLSESYMYLEGKYAHTPPEYYCYVRYNGNGGSTSQSVQGYNANLDATPACVSTYGNYTFAGWYTSPTGGEKVEKLTQAHNKMTLYAHWSEIKYEEPELFEEPIKIKVTGNSVNLRKGPGTNYATIGTADAGDEFEIWQVQQGGSYTWGYYKTGWVCLQYTNYDSVISGTEDEPDVTEPEETEPEETEPEVTVPEETEPEETEPEETKPAETTPAKVTGVVHADPYLCVRSGPGTGYPTVNTLRNGAKVTITEQKTVGSMIWGKTEEGWVSMSYVTVEENFESEPDQTTPTGKTGTVTCSQLNVRSGAGINYGIAGYYYKNDKVTITEQKTVGSTVWGKTAKGWVSMDYIKLESSGSTGSTGNAGSTGSTGTTTTQITGTVNTSDVLRIRSGAGTTYSIVGFLSPNEKVTILEKKVVGATTWGRISKGWVSMDYIKLDSTGTPTLPEDEFEDEDTQSVVKTVTAGNLNIRKEAGTNSTVVGYLTKGAKVTVTETKTVDGQLWGKISTGWICLAYTA